MIVSNSCHKRKLDVICEMDFCKKIKCVHPYMSKEVDHNIEMLAYELDELEWKYRQQSKSAPCR